MNFSKSAQHFAELFKSCRAIVEFYLDPKTTGNPLEPAEILEVNAHLMNYINYFNVLVQKRKPELIAKEMTAWRELFNDHLQSVASNDFTFLQEDNDVVIKQVPLGNTTRIYQINFSKIYQWATNCFMSTSPNSEICGLSSKFRVNLARSLIQVFPEKEVMLVGVVNMYTRKDMGPPPDVSKILGSVLSVAGEIIVENGGEAPDFSGAEQMISGIVSSIGPNSNPQDILKRFNDPSVLEGYVRAGVKAAVPKTS